MRRPTRRIMIAATAIIITLTAALVVSCSPAARAQTPQGPAPSQMQQQVTRLQQEVAALTTTQRQDESYAQTLEQESPLIFECMGQPCQNAQEFTVFDQGTATRPPAPEFSVGEFGDVGTFGTGFAVYAPGSVTNPVVTLNTDGTVTVGGQVLTPADVALLNTLRPGELAFLNRLWCASLPRYQQQTCLTAVKR